VLEWDWPSLEDFGRIAALDTEREKIWRFDPFVLNPAASELTRDGHAVSIEPQSLRLLEYLIRNRDRVVSRDEQIEAIWQGRSISDWAISGAIKALRTALGDQEKNKQFVRTIHSRGYRFVAGVTAKGPDARPADRPTVLVRLFRAPSDAADIAYLADGLTEDLITGLSRHSGLSVLSYNTSRALSDTEPPKSAGISNIVDGSVRQLDDTIRINVAVLDGTGTHQVWAERFDLTRASLLAGYDRIGDRLADVLSPGRPVTPPLQHGTRNPDAYDHYLKGRYAYFKYEPAAFSEALAHFARAAGFDPTFADAFAQQAYCRTTLYVFGLPGADQTLDMAEALARQAIQLDDRSALGHARLGWVLGYRDQPEATIAAFEAAVARDPDSAEVYHAYGETMNRLAQPKRAGPLLQAAFSKDSYFPPSWDFPRGHTEILLGEHDSAIAHFLSVLERAERFIPARVQLARAYWEAGDRQAATGMVAKIKSIAPKYSLAHAGRMFPYPIRNERARLIDALAGAGLQ
jgi:DNA-binding winged helix-turn-helix (wHTH) protein